jgi:hypothetical protein
MVATAGFGLYRVCCWLSVPAAQALTSGEDCLGARFSIQRIALLLGPGPRQLVTRCTGSQPHDVAAATGGRKDVFEGDFFSSGRISQSHAAAAHRGDDSSGSSGSGSGSSSGSRSGSSSSSSSDGSRDDEDTGHHALWEALSEHERDAAATLDWGGATWGARTPKTQQAWDDLADTERDAAAVLGYNEAAWGALGAEPLSTDGAGSALQMRTMSLGQSPPPSRVSELQKQSQQATVLLRPASPQSAGVASPGKRAEVLAARQGLRAQIMRQPDEWIPIARLARPQAVTQEQARQAAVTLRQTLSSPHDGDQTGGHGGELDMDI